MASVNVTNINVLNNPASFVDPFQFEITFECVKELSSDLEWKLTYVGSAESEELDQELDSVLVGPVVLGVNRFIFETPPPDHTKIPKADLIGVTVCLISCLYKGKEFIRIGYYVNNEYDDPSIQLKSTGDDGMDIDESDGEDGEDEEEEEEEEEVVEEEEEEEGEEEKEGAETKDQQTVHESQQQESDQRNTVEGEQGKKMPLADRSNSQHADEQTTRNKVRKMENPEDNQQGKKKKMKQEEESATVFELPANFSVDKIKRHILENKPRLTRFLIDWD